MIRHKVAEMATQAEAAKAITYNALRLFHEGQDCIQEVTMAKLVTQRGVLEIADECLQIHGGYGYMREYGIERAVRDARLGPIGGGTDEIMKEILGKQLGSVGTSSGLQCAWGHRKPARVRTASSMLLPNSW